MYRYSDTTFFPIDNKPFGNEGRDHNFHFTLAGTPGPQRCGGSFHATGASGVRTDRILAR